jgi:hypothetical protein
MSLTNSNTYIEPVAGAALNAARSQFNNSIRSILTNFKSPAAPGVLNLTASGNPLGEQDGMLYRSSTTNALYISDSIHVKNSPVGGNFTRIGIGNRVENGIVALGANAESYEIGELVATVSENGTLAANSRLYLCTSNTKTAGSTAGFIDIGQQAGITSSTNDNVIFTGQSASAQRFIATSNVGIGTSSPATTLHVNGDVTVTDRIIHAGDTNTQIRFPALDTFSIETNGSERLRVVSNGNLGVGTNSPDTTLHINGDVTLTDRIIHAGDTNTQIRFPASDTVTIETSGSERLRVVSNGNVGIGTTSPSEKLDVSGNIRAVDFNSTSDRTLKEDITVIKNALSKVHSITGYTFTLKETNKRSMGVIAQEVEQIFPEVVSGVEGNKSVSYGNLVGLLIEAIKELDEKVDRLEDKLNNK